MLLLWLDDETVLLWPWVLKDGAVLSPAERRRGEHRHGDKRDEDEQDHDHDTEHAVRNE
ncbi:MAG: hypothetical protein WAL41_11865 [Mycobacterium sp.]